MSLKPGYDWFYPYYRDRALCLALGVTPYEMLLARRRLEGRSRLRRAPDAIALGPQAPQHRLRSSPTGTQCLQAIGCAEAGRALRKSHRDRRARATVPPRRGRLRLDRRGSTSEGEFWESLNAACLAGCRSFISSRTTATRFPCPVEVQTAGGDISRLVSSFPGLLVRSIDGTDFVESYRAMTEAIAYARARKGPALVHARVTRPYSHSHSDEEKLYKTRGTGSRGEARPDCATGRVPQDGGARHRR